MIRRVVATMLVVSMSSAPQLLAATVLGGETPQAVVARMDKAAKARDIAEMTACLDPESRAEMATALLLGATMMVGFMGMGADMASGMAEGVAEATGASKDEAQKKSAAGKAEADAKIAKTKAAFSALLKKHGLPDMMDEKAMDSAGDPKTVLAKIDHPAFAKDVMGFLDSIGEGKKGDGGGPTEKMPDMDKVSDYKITGDTATAKAGAETLDFVKVDGRWFLKMPEKKAEAAE
jgi:hypothetical protein